MYKVAVGGLGIPKAAVATMQEVESGSGGGSLGDRIPESCDGCSRSETAIIVQNEVEAVVFPRPKQHQYSQQCMRTQR